MVSRSANRARANAGSPGLGVSGINRGWANLARIDAGSFPSRSYFWLTLQASDTELGSGRAVMARESFTDAAASAATRPPLTADRCLRTALVSLIEAPELTSRRFSC